MIVATPARTVNRPACHPEGVIPTGTRGIHRPLGAYLNVGWGGVYFTVNPASRPLMPKVSKYDVLFV